MHPHADSGEAVPGHHIMRCGESQQHRRGGVDVADHHGVADGLDHLAAARPRGLGHLAAERPRQLGGVGIPVRLGQSGVADDVGEDEGAALVFGHATTVLTDV